MTEPLSKRNSKKKPAPEHSKQSSGTQKKSSSGSQKNSSNTAAIPAKSESKLVGGVQAYESGVGLPYAPEEWPLPGDVWSWRAGRRTTKNGQYFIERFLTVPDRLKSLFPEAPSTFPSKIKVEEYLKENFKHLDIPSFFASFSWRIPCSAVSESNVESPSSSKKAETNDDKKECPVSNGNCALMTAKRWPWMNVKVMNCDICCSETGFCGECCCILCGKTTDQSPEGWSSIKCKAKLHEEFICGHVAHLECAVKCNMAGVRSELELDVEYLCMRCFMKTDLMMEVDRLLNRCHNSKNCDDVKKNLCLALQILKGTQREKARHVEGLLKLSLNECEGP